MKIEESIFTEQLNSDFHILFNSASVLPLILDNYIYDKYMKMCLHRTEPSKWKLTGNELKLFQRHRIIVPDNKDNDVSTYRDLIKIISNNIKINRVVINGKEGLSVYRNTNLIHKLIDLNLCLNKLIVLFVINDYSDIHEFSHFINDRDKAVGKSLICAVIENADNSNVEKISDMVSERIGQYIIINNKLPIDDNIIKRINRKITLNNVNLRLNMLYSNSDELLSNYLQAISDLYRRMHINTINSINISPIIKHDNELMLKIVDHCCSIKYQDVLSNVISIMQLKEKIKQGGYLVGDDIRLLTRIYFRKDEVSFFPKELDCNVDVCKPSDMLDKKWILKRNNFINEGNINNEKYCSKCEIKYICGGIETVDKLMMHQIDTMKNIEARCNKMKFELRLLARIIGLSIVNRNKMNKVSV